MFGSVMIPAVSVQSQFGFEVLQPESGALQLIDFPALIMV